MQHEEFDRCGLGRRPDAGYYASVTAQLLRYVPIVIVCALLIRRTQRPRVIRPGRLWIPLAVVLGVSVLYVAGAIRLGPHIDLTGSLIIAAAALGGAVLGALRAHLLRLSRHPDTGAIQGTFTMWGVLLLVAWYVGRDVLRQSGLAGASAPFGLVSDAALALALGAVVAQRVILMHRCKALSKAKVPLPLQAKI